MTATETATATTTTVKPVTQRLIRAKAIQFDGTNMDDLGLIKTAGGWALPNQGQPQPVQVSDWVVYLPPYDFCQVFSPQAFHQFWEET